MPHHRLIPLTLLLLAALTAATLARAAEPPLNVLIIQTDEHNFRTLGCYRELMSEKQAYIWGPGVKVDHSQHRLDRRKRSHLHLLLRHLTSVHPVPCRPHFRALSAQNTGAPQNNSPLLDDVVSFAEVLKREGYATGYAGKWHLDGPAKPGWAPAEKIRLRRQPLPVQSRALEKTRPKTKMVPRVAATDSQKGRPTYALDGADDKTFTTDFLAARTINFIRTNKEIPPSATW